MESIPLALAYDDVLLTPRFSSIRSRQDINCDTHFVPQIALSAPFVSSNMDTVTEARMATAMALFGGIGVIHRFLPVKDQVAQVSRVKRYRSYVVEDPYTVSPSASIGEARRMMQSLGVSGLPVVEEDRTLAGIFTRRDALLADDTAPVSERMTPRERLVVGEHGISQDEAKRVLSEHRLEKLPLVDSDERLTGLITAKDLATEEGGASPTRDSKGRLAVAAAVGVVGNYVERAQALVQAGADALVIDIAHGDSALMLSTMETLKDSLGPLPLVAGNVATPEAVERLIDAGADAVKVGVGPGSVCITRQVAGAGVPEFTAVVECGKVGQKRGVPIIADGGIRSSGDVAKAIGTGAASVMIGNLLAGTEESPGVIIQRNGSKMKVARGLASQEAVKDRAFREDPERGWAAWEDADVDVAPEGVQGAVPFRGAAREVLSGLLAGLRSGMSYCNASTIEEMWRNARFVRQTASGIHEGRTHDAFRF